MVVPGQPVCQAPSMRATVGGLGFPPVSALQGPLQRRKEPMRESKPPLHSSVLHLPGSAPAPVESPNPGPLFAHARFNAGPNTECIDVDDDGTETHHVARKKFACPRCPGKSYRWHDVYVELSGDAILTAQPFRVCSDCTHETKGSVENVGTVEAPDEATTNRAARRAEAAHKRLSSKGRS